MSAQNKQEKKIMDEKIAKVREVVRNFSTNDIVLALHHFELDVEKTIQAFLQGGHKEALDEWEQTGGASSKKNNKKKNKAKTGGNASTVTSGKVTPANSGNGSVNNGGCNANEFASSVSSSSHAANGVGAHKPDAPAKATNAPAKTGVNGGQINASNTNSASVNGDGTGAAAKAKSAKSKAKHSTTGSVAAEAVAVVAVPAEELAKYQALSDAEKLNVISTEAAQITKYASELNDLEKVFTDEVSSSHRNVLQCFREIKQHLADRERQLCAELDRCRDEASTTFSTRRAQLHELSKKLAGGAAKCAPKDRDALFAELKSFNAAKLEDQQLAYVTRFVYNNAKVLDTVQHFGEVIPVKRFLTAKKESSVVKQHSNGTAAVADKNHAVVNGKDKSHAAVNGKESVGGENGHYHPVVHAANGNGVQNGSSKVHSPSHSSIVSEECSDLSHISPIPNLKPAEKNVAQVATGGIVMQSDNLSADQLADLQKRIEDTLRAQGIDPSVLSDLGVNTIAPRRRPPPGKSAGGGEKRGPGGGGGKNVNVGNRGKGNGNSNGNTQQQQSKPAISILQ